MSKVSSNGNDTDRAQLVTRQFHGFDVSWAGPGRRSGEFCIGSEDGRILMTDAQLAPVAIMNDSLVPSGEAINGVGFLDDLIAVSTRAEVAFVSQQPIEGKGFRSVFPAGAHGIIITPCGYAVAPLGRSGLMVVKPGGRANQPVTVRRISHTTVDFYKVVHIHFAESQVLVCAGRKDGVLAIPFQSGETALISSLTYPGLDVVDVCSLGPDHQAPAVAAVSSDCTLILSLDALRDRKPLTIKFDEIKGTAYRLLNYDGNLLLLTSRAIYVLAGLGRRFMDNEPIRVRPTPVRTVLLEAIDANLAADGLLLVVMSDGVSLFDLAKLVGAVPSAQGADGVQMACPTGVSPQWQPHQNDLRSESMVLAGMS